MWNSLIECSWFHCCETESKLKCLSSKDFQILTKRRKRTSRRFSSLYRSSRRFSSSFISSRSISCFAISTYKIIFAFSLVQWLPKQGWSVVPSQLYQVNDHDDPRLDTLTSPVSNWAYSLSDFLFDFMFPWFENAIDPFLYQQLDALLCFFFDHLKEAIGIHTHRQQIESSSPFLQSPWPFAASQFLSVARPHQAFETSCFDYGDGQQNHHWRLMNTNACGSY